MELKDTVEMMNSDDYKERFKAEYYQLKIRINGLKNMLSRWDNEELNFVPTCPRDIYNDQMEYMTNYMTVLANRAHLEGIELDEEEFINFKNDIMVNILDQLDELRAYAMYKDLRAKKIFDEIINTIEGNIYDRNR